MEVPIQFTETFINLVRNASLHATLKDDSDFKIFSAVWWTYIAIVILLVCFAGMMSGLTLGLLSMSIVDLEVLKESGTRNEKKQARSIYPVVVKQHQLLVTLLFCNAIAMEALPLFLDDLVSPVLAVLLSVTLVLLFGEVIPQAACSRYGLLIGSNLIWLVKFLMIVCFPVSFPLGKLLDHLLGHDEPLFRRKQLKALVSIHGADAGRGGELTHDETTIMRGAIDLTSKTAEEAMTPIESTFSLDINTKLDRDAVRLIDEKGHSRVPVYEGDKKNIIGVVLVKSLLTVRFNEAPPLRSVAIRRIPRMPADMPLYNVLNEFQKGSSHMAVVIKKKRSRSFDYGSRQYDAQTSPQPLPYLHLSDKFDKYQPSSNDNIAISISKSPMITSIENKSMKMKQEGSFPDYPTNDVIIAVDGSSESMAKNGQYGAERGDEKEKSVHSTAGVEGVKASGAGKLESLGAEEKEMEMGRKKEEEMNGVTEDARLASRKSMTEMSGKVGGWKQRSLKKSLVQGGFEWKQSRGSDEEVIGIITLEDIIEELLQEEIVDETDEYIDVHKRIRVTSSLGNQGFFLRKGPFTHRNNNSSPQILDDHFHASKASLYKALYEDKERDEGYVYREMKEPFLKPTTDYA